MHDYRCRLERLHRAASDNNDNLLHSDAEIIVSALVLES